LGLIGVLARSVLPVQRLSCWSEVLVGAALIGIGSWALWQSRKMVLHRHAHAHQEIKAPTAPPPHEHLHVHIDHEAHSNLAHRHHKRSAYGIGLLHGAAGTGHLLGVVPALALSPTQGLLYLTAYGIAAVGAMTGFGALLGLVGDRIAPRLLSNLMRVCGGLAVGLGVYWMVTGWP